jgi:hypothetical protein
LEAVNRYRSNPSSSGADKIPLTDKFEVSMAVLVEGISVIVRRETIQKRFEGGWRAFVETVPNRTFCTDDVLARVGFMNPFDVESYIDTLKERGLQFLADGKALDIAVFDQLRGPTTGCDWLNYARLPLGESGDVIAACWLNDASVEIRSVPPPSDLRIAVPEGWIYKKSLSKQFLFTPNEDLEKDVKYLVSEDGMDIHVHVQTGKIYYSGRPFSEPAADASKKPKRGN